MWALTATCALAACGGSEFTSGGSGSGGLGAAGATNGGADTGGTGGAAPSGGMPNGGSAHGGTGAIGGGGAAHGGSPSAGAGGKTTATCDCSAGSYCQDGINKCRSCTDFTRLQFAAPEKLATVSQTESGDERFPRSGVTTTDLFYRSGKPGTEQIWYDPTPVSGPGQPITSLTAPTPMMQPPDSGPLYAPNKATTANFFFDHFDLASLSRQIMLASWPAGNLAEAMAAPPPLNSVGDNYSIAVAGDAKRAYWMSTRNAKGAQLMWSDLTSGTPTDPQVVDLSIQVGTKSCPITGDDATPWVDLAGTVMLFRSVSVDDSCTPNDSGGYDLFAAPLSKDTGLPTASGIPLSTLNVIGGGSTETDPSFSADACFIYYASDGGTSDFDIYRAARN